MAKAAGFEFIPAHHLQEEFAETECQGDEDEDTEDEDDETDDEEESESGKHSAYRWLRSSRSTDSHLVTWGNFYWILSHTQ